MSSLYLGVCCNYRADRRLTWSRPLCPRHHLPIRPEAGTFTVNRSQLARAADAQASSTPYTHPCTMHHVRYPPFPQAPAYHDRASRGGTPDAALLPSNTRASPRERTQQAQVRYLSPAEDRHPRFPAHFFPQHPVVVSAPTEALLYPHEGRR